MRTRRSTCWVLAGLLALAVATPAAALKDPTVDGGKVEFRVHDLDGNVVTSDDLRFAGKVIVLSLWGTFCPPCITEIPTFNDLQARYGDRGLVIVGMSFERETEAERRRKQVREFSRKHDVSYLVLDGGSTGEFEETLPTVKGVEGLPVEILIDREGNVVEARNTYGYSKRWARKLEKRLVELLGPPAATDD